jgi:hypothetical protein
MILDYLLQPLINTGLDFDGASRALLAASSFRGVGFVDRGCHDRLQPDWCEGFAKANKVLLAVMSVVVVAFVVLTLKYLYGGRAGLNYFPCRRSTIRRPSMRIRF